jgi:hypothetical protein
MHNHGNATALINGLRSKDPTVALCDHKLLTKSGCEWVKLALDPFHDYELPCVEGYPDLSTGTSLVIKAQQSMTISAPTGVTGAWDAHVTAGPLDYGLDCPDGASTLTGSNAAWGGTWEATGCSPGVFTSSLLGDWRNDGCRIECGPVGTDTWSAAPISATHTVSNIVLDQYLETNSDGEQVAYRVISSGFEVVNTSAPLEVGGAVSVYEFENSHTTSATFFEPPPPNLPEDVRAGVANVYRSPPQNLAAAKAFPTARTWAAKDGSYNVVKFSGPNTYSNVGKNDYVFASGTGEPRTSQASYVGGFGVAAGDLSAGRGSVAHHTACTTTGAYYTGMPQGSTLQVTWRVALERIPSTADRTMQSLASPSAPYDAAALELYAQIARLLPPGVPQNYNDAGRWARMIYDKIREVAPAVFPVLQAIALATGNPAFAAGIASVTPHFVQANEARKKAGAQVRAQPKPPPKLAVQAFGKPKGGRKGARAL